MIMMTIFKRNLWAYLVLYINLSSSYFNKVQAKSKKQEVDTFIQKLLESEKFDELADKIAIKAAQRINMYNNKMAQEPLRSGIAMDDTHRSAKRLSSQDLTSKEKKTTIISLKYKRFTRNVLDEDTGENKSTTTKGDETEEQLRNKEDTSGIRRTSDKIEKLQTKEETSNTIKTKAKNNYNDGNHNDESMQKKNTASTKKLTTPNNSIVAGEKETNSTTKTIKNNDGDDDTADEFVTRKETIGNKKTTARLDDEDEDNYLNKFGADGKTQIPLKNYYDDDNNDKDDDAFEKNIKREDTADDENTRGKKRNYENDSDDEVKNTSSEKLRKSKHKDKKEDTSFSPDGDVRKHQRNKNKQKKRPETKDLKSHEDRGNFDENSSRDTNNQDEKAVYKDTGDADPEDEKDNGDSTEERLSNNKILVRREGNTLYAQNLDEYEDYRAQLADSGKRKF